METILRIHMGAPGGPAASLDPLGRYAGLEGRAMTSTIVVEEVDPGCHPLGAGNKVVLAPGRSARRPSLSVGCKSPLTGGVVASHAVSPAAAALRRLGHAAVVVQGQPEGDDLWTIVVDARGVTFAVENRLRIAGNLEAVAELRRVHGPGAALVTIGPAGEVGLGAASIASTVSGGVRPTRHCGLGGSGAVLGSKRVKAIVVGGDVARADALDAAPAEDRGELDSPYRGACGVRDPVVLGELEAIVDDLGLDPTEVAAAVALCMEAGLAHFGDGKASLRLVEEIARGTPLGRVLGSGLLATGEAFGLEPRTGPRRPLEGAGRDGAAALRLGGEDLGEEAHEVVRAERRFEARARAAAAAVGAREGGPGLRPHPIVFGAVDDDLARLFGASDPDADPFDPQLQLPIGLRSAGAVGRPPAVLPPPARKD